MINPKNRSTFEHHIAEHARRAAPQEACGVVAMQTDTLEAIPLRNVHPTPAENFKLDPLEYARLFATGVVKAYYHSHPEGPAEFSEADKLISEETQLPCYLYDLASDTLLAYTPTGYTPPLEGRTYMPGVNDCFSLARDYYRTALGIELQSFNRTSEMMRDGIEDMRERLEAAGFQRQVGRPKNGDLLLLDLRSRTGRPNHIAVYEDGNILHQLLDQPSRFDVYGGFWEDHTQLIYRHTTQC